MNYFKRYLYPVDKSRINEFGFSAEDETEEPKKITTDSESESVVEDEVSPDEKKDQ